MKITDLTLTYREGMRGVSFEPAKTKATTPSPATGEEPTEEEIVAITAAIGMITGRRSRIVSLGSSKKDWSREGLRDHFASHKIR